MSLLYLATFMLANAQVFNSYCVGGSSSPSTTPSFCVHAGPMNQAFVITVHSAANGWVGLGVGSQMAGSSIYTGWKNTTGGVTVI
jgi:hypothetical protein